MTATDLETDFLAELSLPNLEVLRHDVRIDEFSERTFDLIHARTVLMHLPERRDTLRRMASWLAPGGWLLVEDADFGMRMGDADPIWAAHRSTSCSRGTPLFEFYRLSISASSTLAVAAGALTAEEVAQLVARLDQPDFLACGFAFIGAWGRRPPESSSGPGARPC